MWEFVNLSNLGIITELVLNLLQIQPQAHSENAFVGELELQVESLSSCASPAKSHVTSIELHHLLNYTVGCRWHLIIFICIHIIIYPKIIYHWKIRKRSEISAVSRVPTFYIN